MDALIEDQHLLELVRATQAGSRWQFRGSHKYVAPTLGAKPGTVFACDIFNAAFAPIVRGIQTDMEQNQLISELPGCEGPFLGIADPVAPMASSAH
eukprot:6764177-Pyramimonas_sp.AAC.1